MSMSTNAEESDANQSKFYRVVSSEPVTDADELFDTLSKFLMNDKKRQISMEYLDEKDLISSRLTWNNLRNVANTVIDEGCSQREPVPVWIDEKEAIVVDDGNETPHKHTGDTDVKDESDASPKAVMDQTIPESKDDSTQNETKEERKATKQEKKEAKEARKRERAEKREAKKARQEAREAKRLKKEEKKRKRESTGGEE